jgi:ferredoxin
MEMTEPKKLPYNVDGKYYVTEECDGCAYCASVAPENFDFDKESNTYYVSKQPSNEEETEFMQEALDDCPVDAIRAKGNNGATHEGNNL